MTRPIPTSHSRPFELNVVNEIKSPKRKRSRGIVRGERRKSLLWIRPHLHYSTGDIPNDLVVAVTWRTAFSGAHTHRALLTANGANISRLTQQQLWAYACVCAPEEEVLSIVTCQLRLNEELRGHQQLSTVSETLDGFGHRIFASAKYPFQLISDLDFCCSAAFTSEVQRITHLFVRKSRVCVCVRFCFLFSHDEACSYSSHTKSACWKLK